MIGFVSDSYDRFCVWLVWSVLCLIGMIGFVSDWYDRFCVWFVRNKAFLKWALLSICTSCFIYFSVILSVWGTCKCWACLCTHVNEKSSHIYTHMWMKRAHIYIHICQWKELTYIHTYVNEYIRTYVNEKSSFVKSSWIVRKMRHLSSPLPTHMKKETFIITFMNAYEKLRHSSSPLRTHMKKKRFIITFMNAYEKRDIYHHVYERIWKKRHLSSRLWTHMCVHAQQCSTFACVTKKYIKHTYTYIHTCHTYTYTHTYTYVHVTGTNRVALLETSSKTYTYIHTCNTYTYTHTYIHTCNRYKSRGLTGDFFKDIYIHTYM